LHRSFSIHAGLGARIAISLDAGPQFVVSLVGAWLAVVALLNVTLRRKAEETRSAAL